VSPVWISLRKETRALLPAWAAAAVSVAAMAVLSGNRAELGWVAFFVGALTLAAVSIGHEYSHGTLSALLSLPVRRSSLLLTKLAALMPMLLLLSMTAIAVLPAATDLSPSRYSALALACGLVSAFWLTMVCRGPLAGALFAASTVALSHIFAEVALVIRYGWGDHRTADQLAFYDAVLVASLLVGAAITAVASWRLFMRLEAVGGATPGIDLARWWLKRDAPIPAHPLQSTRPHPLWLLTLKELRLQRLTIVVALLFAVGWAAAALWRHEANDRDVLGAVALIYYTLLAVVIGSLASAEERQLGTHEWQTLLPIAGWQQWMVKLGTTLGLALLVSVVIPTLMADLSWRNPAHAGVVLLLTIGSLYVSSLCRSGLQALAWSAPVLVIALQLLSRFALLGFDGRLLAGALAIAAVAAMWFGMENHRSTRPEARRVGWQALWIAAAPTAAVIIAQW
jgi:hypothetical protein